MEAGREGEDHPHQEILDLLLLECNVLYNDEDKQANIAPAPQALPHHLTRLLPSPFNASPVDRSGHRMRDVTCLRTKLH